MKILIAYDGSAHADAAIDDLCHAGLPSQCEALVASVAHSEHPATERAEARLGQFDSPLKAVMQETEALAERGKLRVQSKFPAWSVRGEGLWGNAAKMLLKTIDVWKPDLLVVGSHGRSFAGRVLLGSVSTELVHHAPCNVRIVRNTGPRAEGPLRLVVATDGSDPAKGCVEKIARRSWPAGTQARVVTVMRSLTPMTELTPMLEGQVFSTDPALGVIEEANARERTRLYEVAEATATRLKEAGLIAGTVVSDGDPQHEINAEAERWHADTVFVGARGLGALDRLLLGSVSGAVVSHARCAVEVVRG